MNEAINIKTKFNSKWTLWYHYLKNDWTIKGYKKLYEISTIEEFWLLYNNWNKIGGINNKHFFLMREGILPLWEDPKNINGGCWSFKKDYFQSSNFWNDLSLYLVGETLSPKPYLINGISICLKKKGKKSVIKIWNNDKKYNNNDLLNNNVLEKWGKDIIFIDNKK